MKFFWHAFNSVKLTMSLSFAFQSLHSIPSHGVSQKWFTLMNSAFRRFIPLTFLTLRFVEWCACRRNFGCLPRLNGAPGTKHASATTITPRTTNQSAIPTIPWCAFCLLILFRCFSLFAFCDCFTKLADSMIACALMATNFFPCFVCVKRITPFNLECNFNVKNL